MRLLSAVSQMRLGGLLIFILAAEAVPARVVGLHSGLPMVPAHCKTEKRENINVGRLLVFYNKTVTFDLNNIILKSSIIKSKVEVVYSDEQGTAIFNIGSIIPYRASDIRLYHGTLEDKPVIYWEEVVENVAGRGGIVEYRGHAMFSLCTGPINSPRATRNN